MNNSKEKKSVVLLSILATVFLIVFKLVIGLLTCSLSIISEALNSTIDMVASCITYFAVRLSEKPADKEHNFGHGKIENLSAFLQTILLFGSVIWIFKEAIEKLITNNHNVEITFWSFLVIITSIVIDLSRSRKLRRVAKENNSQAIEADATNFTCDIISSTFVLIGLIFSYFGIPIADAIASMFVGIMIFILACRLGKKSVDVLLDRTPKLIPEQIHNYLKDNNIEYHSLKVRSSGADTIITFDLHMKPDVTLTEAHNICDKIEKDLSNIIKNIDIYIHVEPDTDEHNLTDVDDGLLQNKID